MSAARSADELGAGGLPGGGAARTSWPAVRTSGTGSGGLGPGDVVRQRARPCAPLRGAP